MTFIFILLITIGILTLSISAAVIYRSEHYKIFKKSISLVWWSRTELTLFCTVVFCFYFAQFPYFLSLFLVAVSPLVFYGDTLSILDKTLDISRYVSILKILISVVMFSFLGQLVTTYSLIWAVVLAFQWTVAAILVSKVSIGPVSNRLANRLHRKKAIVQWNTIWEQIKLNPANIKLKKTIRETHGITYIFQLTGGYNYRHFVKYKENIASCYADRMAEIYNISTNNLYINEGKTANYVKIRIKTFDPLASVAPLKNIEVHHRFDRPFPIAIDENGNDILFDMRELHGAVFGVTGSGKSGALHVLTGIAAKDPNCVLYLGDPKGGVELSGWKNLANHFAINHADIADMLDIALDNMRLRLEEMTAAKHRNAWNEKKYKTHVIIIDEIPQLIQNTAPEKTRERVRSQLLQLTQLGRAAKFVVIIAAQRPTSDQIPAEITNNIGARIVLRLQTKDGERIALNKDKIEYGPTNLSEAHPGRCFIVSQRPLTEGRIYHLPNTLLAKWQGEDASETGANALPKDNSGHIIPPIVRSLDENSTTTDERFTKVWALILGDPKTIKEVVTEFNEKYSTSLKDPQITRVVEKLVSNNIASKTKETKEQKKNCKYISFTEPHPDY